ncbi:MAG: hypothetical protein IJ568_06760 [Bacilli bacterium]|nr:hypothetical protein [Bacilli bacterium]
MFIKISSEKDIKKLYKKLWLYKSFLYRKTFFSSNNNIDINTKYIIDALNIKRRRDRITFIFDKTCEIIDAKNKGVDICNFKGRVCLAHQCNKNKTYYDGCCRICLYKTTKGCPTKNIACKLYNCRMVKETFDVYNYNDLKILRLLSLKNRIIVRHDYFSLREDVLKDLYSYSLIYSTIRMVSRIMKNYLKVRKIDKYEGGKK